VLPRGALAKAAAKVTAYGGSAHSLVTLPEEDLTTIAANGIQPVAGPPAFTTITTPTLELLGVYLALRVRVISKHQITTLFRRQTLLLRSTQRELRASRAWLSAHA
jgi:hypothetical protein